MRCQRIRDVPKEAKGGRWKEPNACSTYWKMVYVINIKELLEFPVIFEQYAVPY